VCRTVERFGGEPFHESENVVRQLSRGYRVPFGNVGDGGVEFVDGFG
jgi:hypothetical protein